MRLQFDKKFDKDLLDRKYARIKIYLNNRFKSTAKRKGIIANI